MAAAEATFWTVLLASSNAITQISTQISVFVAAFALFFAVFCLVPRKRALN